MVAYDALSSHFVCSPYSDYCTSVMAFAKATRWQKKTLFEANVESFWQN